MIKISCISKENVKEQLLHELSMILSSDFQNASILARNWKGEINAIQNMLNCLEVRKLGFRIKFDNLEHMERDIEDDEKEVVRKLRMSLHKDSKVIEVINIFAAKGREWDKVILPVNIYYNSLPRPKNVITEERKIFYVGVTRARQELTIYYDGNRDSIFIDQFRELPHSERKKRLELYETSLLAAFENRIINAKNQLKEVTELLSTTFVSQQSRLLEVAPQIARKKHKPELNRIRESITKTKKATRDIESGVEKKLEKAKETIIRQLIPIIGQMESTVNYISKTSNFEPLRSESLEDIKHINTEKEKFLIILNRHGIKRIETLGNSLNLEQHEEVQSRVYSNEVPDGKIISELEQGFMLNDQIIHKAKVVVSKGARRSEWLSNLGSSQTIRIITEDSIYNLVRISLLGALIRGIDRQGMNVRIRESEILFAVTSRNWCIVKSHLKQEERFSPEKSITDEFLRSLLVKESGSDINEHSSSLSLILKAGYILKGKLHSFDNVVLNVFINKKLVVVFRSGLLNILDERDFEKRIDTTSSQIKKPDTTHKVKVDSLFVDDSRIDNSSNANTLKQTKSVKPEAESTSSSQSWERIMMVYAQGSAIDGQVIQQIKGGLKVRIDSLYGLLPASLVDLKRIENLDSFVGKTLKMKILEFNQQENNLILSRRAWLEDERTEFFGGC